MSTLIGYVILVIGILFGSLFPHAPMNLNEEPIDSCFSGRDNWARIQVTGEYGDTFYGPDILDRIKGIPLPDTYISPNGNSTIFTDIAWIDLDRIFYRATVVAHGEHVPLTRIEIYFSPDYNMYFLAFAQPNPDRNGNHMFRNDCFFLVETLNLFHATI